MLTEAKLLELIAQTRKQQEAQPPRLTMRPSALAAVPEAPTPAQVFARFRDGPLLYATVKLRRVRAEQLRRLLARPDDLDLDTFNREVWQIGNTLSFGGEVVTPWSEDYQLVDAVWLKEFEQAVEAGNVEFHGNSVWKPGARIYDPRRQDTSEKAEDIRRACRILNDSRLPPVQKAQAIKALPGFGWDSATGLVMICLPERFVIYNGPTRDGLRMLGYSYHDLETFERAAEKLKARLESADFLELGWFLFLLSKGCLPAPREKGPRAVDTGGLMVENEERLGRALSVLTQEPLSTSQLKEKAGLRGQRDPVTRLLQAAARRGQVRCHGKNDRGEYLWSLPIPNVGRTQARR
jgi:hypothetical protein